MLRDLSELVNSSKDHYQETFLCRDFRLNRSFKERFSRVMEEKNWSILYNDFSAEITTRENKKIFCPNQWFYLATFVVDLLKELLTYKDAIEQVIESLGGEMTRREFNDILKELKSNDEDVSEREQVEEAIFDYFQDEQEDALYLIKFITDYDWWHGQKTIDRGDFYVSPILNILGLVNVSQSFVADIAYSLASDQELMECALNLQSQEISNSTVNPGINLIVYGAPGTGKSHYLENNFRNFTRVVFHSEYSYYDFVGCYKPTPIYKRTDGSLIKVNGDSFDFGEPLINYEYVAGPFIDTLIEAVQNQGNEYTLLIEELNRANAPAVFGDIFQLLDRNTDGTSRYRIKPNKDLHNYLMSLDNIRGIFSDGLFIPGNMNIVATMNSADQGVFVLDSAFKRRWRFKYMPIIENGFIHENHLINYAGESFEWRHILACINKKLKDLKVPEDRLIGPYFISPNEIQDIDYFTSKVLIYLWDDVARYKREEFFTENIGTYSDLIAGFKDDLDVLNIKEQINEIINNEQTTVDEEDEQEMEVSLEEDE